MSDFGIIGIGLVGQNLALNALSKGYCVSVFNKVEEIALSNNLEKRYQIEIKTKESLSEDGDKPGQLVLCDTLESFVSSIKPNNKIVIMLIPSGEPVDEFICEILPYLEVYI